MATIDLPGLLKEIGDTVVADVKEVVKSEALPPELKARALQWAAGAAAELAKAGAAKATGDTAGYDAAMREVKLYGQAAQAVATGELLIGIAAAEREARKALAKVIDTGTSIGLKVLLAAIV